MRALHVRPEAELDMFEAALWYDREQSPFGIFFVVENESATVLAVTHLHRHPASWQGRR